jgi:transposase
MYGVDKRVEVRAAFAAGKKIKQIVKELEVSRGFVRGVLRAETAEATYAKRQRQPMPKMAAFAARLEAMLEADAARPKKDRLQLTRIFDLLQREGYAGGYDAVRRFAMRWQAQTKPTPPSAAFIPLSFAPGEAFQFDWSHETVVLAGATTTVKVAQVRLAHSRKFYIRAYLRETQEMVFDAHDKAFAFFGGAPSRGIYDNMKTAVDLVFVGKDRTFNRRFLLLADHYRFTPTACTPAAGWEKGQVERQVGVSRERIFKPTLHVASLTELNEYLEAECRRLCATHTHPDERDRTIDEMFGREAPFLSPLPAPFAGFQERDTSANV